MKALRSESPDLPDDSTAIAILSEVCDAMYAVKEAELSASIDAAAAYMKARADRTQDNMETRTEYRAMAAGLDAMRGVLGRS